MSCSTKSVSLTCKNKGNISENDFDLSFVAKGIEDHQHKHLCLPAHHVENKSKDRLSFFAIGTIAFEALEIISNKTEHNQMMFDLVNHLLTEY